MPAKSAKRQICFVTGTRAELGLMLRTLAAIKAHPNLDLCIIATGMHLDPRANPNGVKLAALKAAGLTPTAVVPWPPCVTPEATAEATAFAAAHLARSFLRLKPDIVLLVGDRVEAFAAATAAHISRIPIAHVHGGDKAEGQLDDSLRHAITKLSHLHFAATKDSATRIQNLGETKQSIHLVGAPGVESIIKQAASTKEVKTYLNGLAAARGRRLVPLQETALVLLHPTTPDPAEEERKALQLLTALHQQNLNTLLLLPNNDPGNEGIHRAWNRATTPALGTGNGTAPALFTGTLSDLPRPIFLALLRDCRLLAGNSSAGIIEAASFNCPVLNVGPRQSGREHGPNVTHARHNNHCLKMCLQAILAKPRKAKASHNPYERKDTAKRIAMILAQSPLTYPAPPKLITY